MSDYNGDFSENHGFQTVVHFGLACPCHWSQQVHFLAASSIEGSYHFCKESAFCAFLNSII